MKQEVQKFSKEEMSSTMKRTKSGKAVCPDDIPMEAWRCLGD